MYNKLVFSSLTITDANLYDSVEYLQEWNGEEDYCIGTTASASFTFTTNITTLAVGNSFTYYIKQENDTDWRQIGIFTIASLEKVQNITQGERWKITAYDNICKFDIVIDDWLDSLTFPITLGNMFSSLCTYCGCTAASTSFINSTQSIKDNFDTENITGRTILGYMGQMAAATVYATSTGSIAMGYYTANSTTIDNSKATAITKAEYTTDPVDKVWVGIDSDDTGCVSGTGDNAIRIEYNPLFFAETVAEIQGAVDNVYNQVHSVTYVPTTIELLQDYSINAGDIISVNGSSTLVMTKKITSSGTTFECTGNKTREVESDSNSAINALRGKYTKIKTDLGNITIELGDVEGDVAQIELDVSGLKTRVSDAEGNISTLEQTTTSIESRVTSAEGNISTISSKVTEDEASIDLLVEGRGTSSASIKIEAVAEAAAEGINDSSGSSKITIDADHIEMTGTTTFLTAKDVGESGSTTISGSRITTGTINADTVNVTNVHADNISVSGQSIGSGSSSLDSIYSGYSYNKNLVVSPNFTVSDSPSGGSHTWAIMDGNGITSGGVTLSWSDLVNMSSTAKFG